MAWGPRRRSTRWCRHHTVLAPPLLLGELEVVAIATLEVVLPRELVCLAVLPRVALALLQGLSARKTLKFANIIHGTIEQLTLKFKAKLLRS